MLPIGVRLEGAARTGVDPGKPLDPYSAGATQTRAPGDWASTGVDDHGWADRSRDRPVGAAYGRPTVKNTIAALVLVLDEAVRDGLLVPTARSRARPCSATMHSLTRQRAAATGALHQAIDLAAQTRGAGGLSLISTRELAPWRQEPSSSTSTIASTTS